MKSTALHRPGKEKRNRTERSVAGHLLKMLRSGDDARITKVKRIRQSIRGRSYENDLKLSIAIDRMFKELAR